VIGGVPFPCRAAATHLPQLFRDLVTRLRADIPFGTKGPLSTMAAGHGISRRRLGYTAAMIVEESRILQVCIFHNLEKNLDCINFSVLLRQVMTIGRGGLTAQAGDGVLCPGVSPRHVSSLSTCCAPSAQPRFWHPRQHLSFTVAVTHQAWSISASLRPAVRRVVFNGQTMKLRLPLVSPRFDRPFAERNRKLLRDRAQTRPRSSLHVF
jgi:hypothetical protein